MAGRIKRVLVYTHNSVGMGHAFRTLAVITGMKRHGPDIDFLVLSGSSIPQIFLNEGIEVIKLPGIKKEVEKPGNPMRPRYLTSVDVTALSAYRRRVILETFDFFSPDAVMIEHYMGGLMNEALPLIQRKAAREGSLGDFPLIHLSRGICRALDSCEPLDGSRPYAPVPDLARCFDFIYVFEDCGTLDFNREFLGNTPDVESRVRYLGPITCKAAHELMHRADVLERFGLIDGPVVLITLGRHGPILEMTRGLLDALQSLALGSLSSRVVLMMDPYLDRDVSHLLRTDPATRDVLFLPFTPHLIDLINVSQLVICRAGYNVINEVLLTGTAALVIPEYHATGEQERRAALLQRENIVVMHEGTLLRSSLSGVLQDLLSRPKVSCIHGCDKYAVGRRILADLEDWHALKEERPHEEVFSKTFQSL